MPVYIATQAQGMRGATMEIVVATAGVVLGTLLGVKLLRTIPERIFRRAVSILIIVLGVYMLARGVTQLTYHSRGQSRTDVHPATKLVGSWPANGVNRNAALPPSSA